MSLLLALVRHGVTDWNEQGRVMGRAAVPLNARGRGQAAAAAAALARMRIDAVVASPQRRAQETAAVIAAARGLPIATDDDLAEVWVADAWQGHTFEELRDDPDIIRHVTDPAHECAAIEPAGAVQKRAIAAVARLQTGSAGDRICVVSHGDPIRVLLAHCLGAPIAEFRRLEVSPGSISLVRLGAQPPRVLAVNWRPELASA
jgi:broad specificity phosphatase PhoE